jgi:hypothetical protein
MAAAFKALSHSEIPRGTSALNAIQRIAGAIGTALPSPPARPAIRPVPPRSLRCHSTPGCLLRRRWPRPSAPHSGWPPG